MKIRTLTAIGAAAMFLLPLTSNAAPPLVNQGPAVRAEPRPESRPELQPKGAEAKPKLLSEIKVDAVMALPGEKKTFKALLTQKGNANNPLAHKKVTFRIDGRDGKAPHIVIGSAETENDGRAKLDFAIPDLAQGGYDIKATFAGDDQHGGSNDEANLGVFKGITELEVQHSYGTYKGEPGSPYHTLTISLLRKVDKKALNKKLQITDNGKTTTYDIGQYLVLQVVLQPMNVAKHTVHIQFEGDDSNLATAFDKSYDKS